MATVCLIIIIRLIYHGTYYFLDGHANVKIFYLAHILTSLYLQVP